MKLIILLMLGVFTLTTSFAQTTSPCEDVKFLELKKKGVENLTEIEMTYYTQKEKECDQFSKANQNNATTLESVNSQISQKNKREKEYQAKRSKQTFSRWFWFLALVGGLVYAAAQQSTGK